MRREAFRRIVGNERQDSVAPGRVWTSPQNRFHIGVKLLQRRHVACQGTNEALLQFADVDEGLFESLAPQQDTIRVGKTHRQAQHLATARQRTGQSQIGAVRRIEEPRQPIPQVVGDLLGRRLQIRRLDTVHGDVNGFQVGKPLLSCKQENPDRDCKDDENVADRAKVTASFPRRLEKPAAEKHKRQAQSRSENQSLYPGFRDRAVAGQCIGDLQQQPCGREVHRRRAVDPSLNKLPEQLPETHASSLA